MFFSLKSEQHILLKRPQVDNMSCTHPYQTPPKPTTSKIQNFIALIDVLCHLYCFDM